MNYTALFCTMLLISSIQSMPFCGIPTDTEEYLFQAPMSPDEACAALVKFKKAGTPSGELWSFVQELEILYRDQTLESLKELATQHIESLPALDKKNILQIFDSQIKVREQRKKPHEPYWIERQISAACTVVWNTLAGNRENTDS